MGRNWGEREWGGALRANSFCVTGHVSNDAALALQKSHGTTAVALFFCSSAFSPTFFAVGGGRSGRAAKMVVLCYCGLNTSLCQKNPDGRDKRENMTSGTLLTVFTLTYSVVSEALDIASKQNLSAIGLQGSRLGTPITYHVAGLRGKLGAEREGENPEKVGVGNRRQGSLTTGVSGPVVRHFQGIFLGLFFFYSTKYHFVFPLSGYKVRYRVNSMALQLYAVSLSLYLL